MRVKKNLQNIKYIKVTDTSCVLTCANKRKTIYIKVLNNDEEQMCIGRQYTVEIDVTKGKMYKIKKKAMQTDVLAK